MKYFMIAGEASGDVHGGALIRELRNADARSEFIFFGGEKMSEAAGKEAVVDIRSTAYMGFTDVLKHLGTVRKNLQTAIATLKEAKPDALVVIDYPTFNLKVAKEAKALGVPVFYYIPPKVWAWKKWRTKSILATCSRVFTIFPFESEFYDATGLTKEGQVVYAGNPSVEETDRLLQGAETHEAFLLKYKLRPNRPLVALMPGSRKGEIAANLRVMLETMDRFTQYKGLILGAQGVDDEFYSRLLGGREIPVVREDAALVLKHCRGALVTSGTATLESALCGVPQVALYRSNGSKLAYKLMEKVLSVKYVTLPNLIADKRIIPEMLLHECTAENVSAELSKLLRLDSEARNAQLEGYKEVRMILGTKKAAETAARSIVSCIQA